MTSLLLNAARIPRDAASPSPAVAGPAAGEERSVAACFAPIGDREVAFIEEMEALGVYRGRVVRGILHVVEVEGRKGRQSYQAKTLHKALRLAAEAVRGER